MICMISRGGNLSPLTCQRIILSCCWYRYHVYITSHYRWIIKFHIPSEHSLQYTGACCWYRDNEWDPGQIQSGHTHWSMALHQEVWLPLKSFWPSHHHKSLILLLHAQPPWFVPSLQLPQCIWSEFQDPRCNVEQYLVIVHIKHSKPTVVSHR